MKLSCLINKLVVFMVLASLVMAAGCSTHGYYPQDFAAASPAPVAMEAPMTAAVSPLQPNYDALKREEYNRITENRFRSVLENPLSTFSIDVDTASYSNVRRFIDRGELPPVDAVRIEELVNYFDYDYPQPASDVPFSITTEVGAAPWNNGHQLVHIGLKARNVDDSQIPPTNLVFLIDVSGSMYARLPLVKSSLKLLVNRMRPEDRIAIVVYAGAAGLVLESTSGRDRQTIREAIDQLEAGGSTAGGEGIRLAYQVAQQNFISDGNNRIVLATDGDFNVGISSQDDLQKLIENKREHGVFLTVLGFGMGNYRDGLMETLADKGNGNYAYIDSMHEATKTLVKEFGGTMLTLAKDVKIQVQFNPKVVSSYRLIGYENRLLNNEDFDDDKKDAGEIGAGHTVTAIYEVIPVSKISRIDIPRYVSPGSKSGKDDELMYVKFRYKPPQGNASKLVSKIVRTQKIQNNTERFKFSAAVAEFGMLLRSSQFKANASYQQVLELARAGKGKDKNGYRSQFIGMVKTVSAMEKVN